MRHTIEYASSRDEVWRAYWRSWARPAGLWRVHVTIALGIAAASELLLHGSAWHVSSLAVTAALAGLACVMLFPLWPQLRFKSATRKLTIDKDGFKTTIGARSGERSWQEIAAVEDIGEEILIIVKTGNAMVVPRRAFANETERARFLDVARNWHSLAIGEASVAMNSADARREGKGAGPVVVGLTRRRVWEGLVVNLGIGALAVCLGIVARLRDGKPADQYPGLFESILTLAFLFVMPSVLWLILMAVLCSVTLRLKDGEVEQVLWNRFVLKRAPLVELAGISQGGFSALVLDFAGGKRIALPGIHHDDQRRFVALLLENRPDLELG